ncbi:uncharacterized protein EI90DRAFT_3132882 [Cantharellus anzutake]|uniref:uncharacterized protein n=1 Tax=Cantharellus anzutake TaxID=1750568 RepID=UPI001904D626|nr:uncharacterized protein EI90DRAFT_3132882 [Cantharellus anzutake]KAF8318903.1 hypothetical protein EI90DRAFT_3132882 [Cantharellus anzutake]
MSHIILKWVNSVTDAIENSPFSYPQNSATCDHYEGFGLRLVCFLVRMCMEEFPLKLSFTMEQIHHARMVRAYPNDPTTTDERWDDAIHGLMVSVFFGLPSNFRRESEKHPISIFLMLINLHPTTGNFPKCSTISGRLSAMMYLFRVMAVKMIWKEAEK